MDQRRQLHAMNVPKIFIDGAAGTTGLEINVRLRDRSDIEILTLSDEKRKDASERERLLNACDLAILCLPDEAAVEAVSLIKNDRTKVLDASTAHRVKGGWIYGFAELDRGQEKKIREAKRVSNPGCYPTGALGLLRPLRDASLLAPTERITINAVSGYSGGGKELIALCENEATRASGRGGPFCLYGLDQKHKHIPEIKAHGRFDVDPIFLPSYSHAFYRGMLVHIVLSFEGGGKIYEAYQKHYGPHKNIILHEPQINLTKGYVLSPLDQNNTNNLELRIFENPEKGTLILTACLDNLGKGAGGAAVQNMELMLSLN